MLFFIHWNSKFGIFFIGIWGNHVRLSNIGSIIATSISIALNAYNKCERCCCRFADDLTGDADDSPENWRKKNKRRWFEMHHNDIMVEEEKVKPLTAYDMQRNGGRSTIWWIARIISRMIFPCGFDEQWANLLNVWNNKCQMKIHSNWRVIFMCEMCNTYRILSPL